MVELNDSYWSERYQENKTGWDLGSANPYLIQLVQENVSKDARILIPGAGNAYEVEELFRLGYTNVYALDWAKEPLYELKNRIPELPDSQLIHESFFDHDSQYDLIVEQTFFCALDPKLRSSYVSKMHELLNEGGKLLGVMFNREDLPGPPFGGTISEYENLFSKYFEKYSFKPCEHSIKPRLGSECEVNVVK